MSQSSSPVPRNKRSGCRTPPRSIPGSLDSRRGSPKRSSPKRLSPTRSSGEIRREVRDHRAASYDAAHDGDAAADEVEGIVGSLLLSFHIHMDESSFFDGCWRCRWMIGLAKSVSRQQGGGLYGIPTFSRGWLRVDDSFTGWIVDFSSAIFALRWSCIVLHVFWSLMLHSGLSHFG